MEFKQEKLDCSVTCNGASAPAQVHLVEVRYSDRIIFWNVVMSLTEEAFDVLTNAGYGAKSTSLEIILPDGRQGHLDVLYGRIRDGYREIAGAGKPS